jgi:hypothetical protein
VCPCRNVSFLDVCSTHDGSSALEIAAVLRGELSFVIDHSRKKKESGLFHNDNISVVLNAVLQPFM